MADAQETAPPEPDDEFAAKWIGREIGGRYRISELLAEGGMGAVFVAEHLTLPKQVAIKTIRDDFSTSKTAEERFSREALATARIDHPHVASAIDHGRLPEGGAYLVMQLVRGESLSQRLAHGPLPWPKVCLIGSQVADALAAAHAIGIVHRDLKPENIVLEARGDDAGVHARVIDFGIAHVSAVSGSETSKMARKLTRVGTVLGTPGYMAPEQTIGAEIDFRADLYALGVILWECCAGRFLWETETITELRAFQFSQPALSLRQARAGKVPEALAVLVDKLLERKVVDRPESAAAVRDELRQLALRGELGGAVGLPTMTGAPPAARPEPPPAPPEPTPATPARPTAVVWIVLVAVALLAVVVIVLIATQ